jgi:GrpB-like predicted nucleotidyltransferase (UPF0157 family)
MLGLKRHTVKIVSHDPDWIVQGENRCDRIKYICHDLIVAAQHVGSTSVPNLSAKPILDILIGVRDDSCMLLLKTKMESMGYLDRGMRDGGSGHLFIKESAPDIRTEHVHVVIFGSEYWFDYIVFKARLISDNKCLKNYEKIKIRLADEYSLRRDEYTSRKADFIREAIRRGGLRPLTGNHRFGYPHGAGDRNVVKFGMW